MPMTDKLADELLRMLRDGWDVPLATEEEVARMRGSGMSWNGVTRADIADLLDKNAVRVDDKGFVRLV